MKTKQVILLGPPGVGVKEHATTLAQRWRIPHVSMGDLHHSSGQAATEPLADEVAIKLIKRRFEQPDVVLKGWVLDGFPQNLAQARAFDDWWAKFGKPETTVVYLKAMTGILLNRLSMEPGHPPDNEIRRRLSCHKEDIAPLLAYYQGPETHSQLKTINASVSFAEVAQTLAQLGQEDTGAARLVKDETELDALLAKEPSLVVDCMASWCGSCKQVAPLVDRLAQSHKERTTIVKIDFDVNRQITKRFGLKGIPAVMFFKQGELQETLTGVKAYGEYEAAATRLLAAPVNV
ncbi:MAG: nucleoside monophosphate kinase [Leptolyngbyaceae cyanobacterium]